MTDDSTPRAAEAVPVMLARMEGKLDRVQDRVDELVPRVGKIEERLTAQEIMTLGLSKDAGAEEAKKIALALALKEADETRRNQSEQTWTPVQRAMVILGGVVGAAALFIQYFAKTGG
ncbi:MAG: hypothetical protein M3536_02545 [Actinomycetota bacterium]|nr:hypothetical protein [Actinomycetota bacterium]